MHPSQNSWICQSTPQKVMTQRQQHFLERGAWCNDVGDRSTRDWRVWSFATQIQMSWEQVFFLLKSFIFVFGVLLRIDISYTLLKNLTDNIWYFDNNFLSLFSCFLLSHCSKRLLSDFCENVNFINFESLKGGDQLLRTQLDVETSLKIL